jgi:hypothetical protein
MRTKFLISTIFLSMCMCFVFTATSLKALSPLVVKVFEKKTSEQHEPQISISVGIKDQAPFFTPEYMTLDNIVELLVRFYEITFDKDTIVIETNSIQLSTHLALKYLSRLKCKRPLFVFDLDRTLIIPEGLGPDDFFPELMRKYEKKARDMDRETSVQFAVQGVSASLASTQMIPVESVTVPVINWLQHPKDDTSFFMIPAPVLPYDLRKQFNNIATIALTSRTPGQIDSSRDLMVEGTLQQLSSLDLNFSEGCPRFVHPIKNGKLVNGVYFLKAQRDKGTALADMLGKIRHSEKPDCLVFFDDSMQHVLDFAVEAKSHKIPCLAFYYTAAQDRTCSIPRSEIRRRYVNIALTANPEADHEIAALLAKCAAELIDHSPDISACTSPTMQRSVSVADMTYFRRR